MKTITLTLAFVAVALTGCSTIAPPTRVTPSMKVSSVEAISKRLFSDGDFARLDAEFRASGTSPVRKNEIADALANDLLSIHEVEYQYFVDALGRGRALKNTAIKSTSLALTTLATALSNVDYKTGFAAAATALTGMNEIHENENFRNRSMDAIRGAMEAQRVPKKEEIEREIRKADTDWPTCRRMLLEYESYASVDGALSFLSTLAASEKARALQALK